jgi:acetyl esterase
MLISDGVDALLNKTAGTIHGFEVNYDSAYTREIIKERINYMNKLFYATHG